ncbi:PAS domain-containing protein [Labilibaculum sp. DW002]|uniref:histidine kinase n=1 Tax=Paralabilibaculum antarcticum TaxID=2912572 RepID=A0ABT5VXB1_9BACT|nr:PAS domain-containing hybrid sensor histidine kinase/response regulator [Labilibaculum sp. DW002]MDE5420056.1 PAS domain-containing protein [Labilibaculum sp. DW002]
MNYQNRTKQQLIDKLLDLERANELLKTNSANNSLDIDNCYACFYNMFNDNPVGMAICQIIRDELGNPIDFIHHKVNNSTEQQTGFKPEMLLNKKTSELISKKETDHFVKIYSKVVETKKSISYEQYFPIYKRHLEVVAFPLENDFFGISYSDISTQKKDQKRFKYILENSISVIYNFNIKTGSYEYVSPSTSNVFGYPSELFLKEGLSEVLKHVHPEDLQRSKDHAEHLYSGNFAQFPIVEEYRFKHPKLGYRWISDTRTIILDEEGKAISIIGSAYDVTTKKESEIALLESENKFRKLLEGTPLPLCYVDKNEIISFRNDRFIKVFGYTDEDVPNLKKWWIAAYPDPEYRKWVVENWNNAVEKAMKNGTDIKSEEYKVTCKDGSVRDIIISGITIHDNFLATFIDITDINKVQIDLIHAKEKAEESDRLKSAFLANMSHEIRTPMNGILGFSDLLKDQKITGEKQLKYLTIIEESGTRMLNIIDDLMDISKIESGQMELSITTTNINDQLDYIYDFFKPEIEAKGIMFNLDKALLNKEAYLRTDKEKLYSILVKLINNSIKYTDSGTINFGYQKKNNELEFFVKDTGTGILSSRLNAIFDRFVQADILDRKALQGAGLGLSITKAYVEMLDGNIWVNSKYGEGSEFYFSLPYNSEIKSKKHIKITADNQKPMIKPLTILIAEDDEASDYFLSSVVKPFSKQTLKTDTGEGAIEMCKKHTDIDLILMDIKFRGKNGYEATEEIRSFNKDIIIIAQTAYGLAEDRSKCINAGCNDYVSKPINKQILLNKIKKYFPV